MLELVRDLVELMRIDLAGGPEGQRLDFRALTGRSSMSCANAEMRRLQLEYPGSAGRPPLRLSADAT